MKNLIEKTNVLMEAMPYIRHFRGKHFVIKYGGSAMKDKKLRQSIVTDAVFMKFVGIHPIIVHGGGPFISDELRKAGIKTKFVDGLRVTDEKAIKIVEDVLVNKINKQIGEMISKAGGEGLLINGADHGMINVSKHFVEKGGKQIDIGFVGDVEKIDKKLIDKLGDEKNIPVVAPLGRDDKGATFNVNADNVAGRIASALPSEKLVLLTDVPGIMRDAKDESSLFTHVSIKEVHKLIKEKVIAEGMIPKVNACVKALEKGVGKTHIIDGRIVHSLLLEIFTDKGIGTEIVK